MFYVLYLCPEAVLSGGGTSVNLSPRMIRGRGEQEEGTNWEEEESVSFQEAWGWGSLCTVGRSCRLSSGQFPHELRTLSPLNAAGWGEA